MKRVESSDDPLWLRIAAKEIGIKEMVGIKHHPRILQYHQATSLKAMSENISWCASFINWCLREAGIEGTKSPAARSFERWGIPLEWPVKGCIAVFWRGDPNSWQGHVSLYISTDQHGNFRCLGGNQGDAVRVSTYNKDRLIGFRWPEQYQHLL